MLAWFSYSIGTSALLSLAAAAAESLVAAWRWPRRAVWLVAMALTIAAPIFLAFRATDRGEVRAASPAFVDRARARAVGNSILPRVAGVGDDLVTRSTVAMSDRRLLRIWGACSASLLAFLILGAVRLERQLRRWRPTAIDGCEVLVAPDVGPAVVGFIRPRVVLPDWSLTLDASALSLIVCHEREHIRARDPCLLHFAALAIALFPWNVILWLMARRLVLAVELDCDQRVLRTTASVREYGLVLLEVVSRRDARDLLLTASFIQPRGFLARRVKAMVTLDANRPRLVSLALVTSIVAFTVAAARVPRPMPLRMSASGALTATSKFAHVASVESTRLTPLSPSPATVRQGAAAVVAHGEPGPRITADWENAPIELVVVAFARFSGRKITLAANVDGLVTARINDQPWDEALEQVMRLHGYRVVVNADSSMTIVVAR